MSEFCPATTKQRHVTQAEANNMLRRLRKTKGYKGHAFHCAHCGDWHVGQSKPLSQRHPASRASLDPRLLARARDKWLLSPEGQKCLSADPHGEYLQQRLTLAFLAGVDAALAIIHSNLPKTKPRG